MSPLPAGAGAVRCAECGAEARADGSGRRLVLTHDRKCVEGKLPRLPEWAQAYVRRLRMDLDHARCEITHAQEAADMTALSSMSGERSPFVVQTHDQMYGTPTDTTITVEGVGVELEIEYDVNGARCLKVWCVHDMVLMPVSTNVVLIKEITPDRLKKENGHGG